MLDPSNKEFYSLIVPKRGLDFLRLRAFFIIMKNLKGVYIIGEYHKYEDSIIFKVGKSSNVLARLGSIQTGNPRILKVIAVLRHSDMAAIETYLHQLFDEYRLQGEWFKMNQSHIDVIENHYPLLHDALSEFYYYCQDIPWHEYSWRHKSMNFKIIEV